MTRGALQDRLVFWQNSVSIHQAPLVRALSEQREVVVVAEADVSVTRARMGWARPDYGAADVVVAPDGAERAELERRLARQAIHVFSGLLAYPATSSSTRAVLAAGGVTGIFAEPWDPDGWRGAVRRVRYQRRARGLVDSLSFVLTTGRLGRRQYEGLGIPRTKVLDFGYFIEPPAADAAQPRPAARPLRPLRLLSAASLVELKRVEWTLRALAASDPATTLDVIGDGPLRARLEELAGKLGLGERVTWHGNVSNAEARQLMAASDVLVLASRYDGWGVVVNEALHSGARVLVSDRCGAADLVRGELQGRVFDGARPETLQAALTDAIERGPSSAADRSGLADWSARHASAQVAATHLLSAVDAVLAGADPPQAPWLR